MASVISPAFWDLSKDIQSMQHSEYWLKGGRGSTKSSFVSLQIILGLLLDPQANAIVYRRVGNTLKDSVFGQLVWAIDTLGRSDKFRFYKSPLEIVHRQTGQRILFRGADDPLKSKSIKLTKGYFKYLWFEEVSEFKGMDDIRSIKQSVFRGVDKAITLYTYNPPQTAQAWVNEEVLVSRPDRRIHHSTYLDVPADWLKGAFIDEAEELRKVNDRAYRHEYLGEVTGTGGQVFENLQLREISDDTIQTFGYTYAGMDFGWFPDPLAFVKVSFDANRRVLWVFDEYCTNKTPNAEVAAYLLSSGKLRHDEELIADSAEPKSISDMRACGLRCTGAVKGVGSVASSIRWLQSMNEIIIDPKRCSNAAKEFAQYEYEKTRDGKPVSAYPDAENHFIDAVRYALNRLWMRRGT